jgi:hypothetical protein
VRIGGAKFFAAVALALLAAGLVACGKSGEAGPGSSTDRSDTTTAASRPRSHHPPLAVALALDAAVKRGRAATEYAEDAAILESLVIERGGSFRVSVFRGAGILAGAGSVNPEDPPEKRYREAVKATAVVNPYVDQTLWQMPREGAVAKHLAALPEGRAVGASLREALRAVRGKQGERWVVIASHGFDDTRGQLPLQSVPQTARILRETVGDVDARGVGIAMVGVGLDRKHSSWKQDGPLTRAWTTVCEEIHARQCEVHADPRLPPPLHGTSEAVLGGSF